MESTRLAPARETGGWQPIETAPRDGTNVILTNGEAVAQGWWADEPGYIREQRDLDGVYLGQDESDGFTGWMDCDGGMQPDPTLWQPLPDAPSLPTSSEALSHCQVKLAPSQL